MELYPFQRELVEKFADNYMDYPHVLIGDDMGLGKTVSAIALDRVRRQHELSERQREWIGDWRRMTLVATKKSVISSWVDHFTKMAPDLKVVSLLDYDRNYLLDLARRQMADVFIVNWDALRLIPTLNQIAWLHIIGDEVQAIKNRKAQVTQSYKRLQALFKTDMSGTWADNKPEDGWSILNHLYPRKWSSYWAYYNRHIIFRSKINPKTGQSYREVVGVAEADELAQEMAPFYIRRLKEVVAPDLPEKVTNTIRVRLHPKQQRAYDDMRRDMLAWVGENEDQPVAAPVLIAKLIRLQQFAIAYGETQLVPRNMWKDLLNGESAKKMAERGFKVRSRETMGGATVWQAYMQIMQNKLILTDPSAKLDAVMDWLEEIPSTESAVVFGTSKLAMYLLRDRLKKVGESHGLLTGDVTSDIERRNLVDDFQAGKYRVFLGTIKAGGVGITLTRASRMGFIDRDWSPSANRQAEDRIHRIGQERTCFYTDFIAEGTLDEERNRKIEQKWDWVRMVLGDKVPRRQ